MGPIHNILGLEQGSVSSSDYWKMYNRSQLDMCQQSELGVPMFDQVVSAIGQADNTAAVSTDLSSIQLFMNLNLHFSETHNIKFCPPKTHLQVFHRPSQSDIVYLDSLLNPVNISGHKVEFSTSAEHVGVIRSVTGNMPNILNRISAHRKALYSVLSVGLARGHRGNPAASIHVERVYGTPVLLSGLGSLLLKGDEMRVLETHYRNTVRNLLRLYDKTAIPVIHFLSGTLPLAGQLHLRQLTLLGMISRQPGSVLQKHGINILVQAAKASKSWFLQIYDICLLYKLPHPISILTNPLPKAQFKSIIKSKVIDYWESKLREDASKMSSLIYFQPKFYSLKQIHPIFSSAGSNPFYVKQATIQAILLSSRFRCERVCRFWTPNNPTGLCSVKECSDQNLIGDIYHILVVCKTLQETRERLLRECHQYAIIYPLLSSIISQYAVLSSPHFCQFMIDCSVLPPLIKLKQEFGQSVFQIIFKITRNYCYALYRTRLKNIENMLNKN